jgi:type II secretory pathway component PulM
MSTDYDTDFHAWAQEQAGLLRAGRFSQLDIDHVAEEIEDLGKRERRALQSRLGVLLGHLLKWRYQPEYANRKSWRATINAQRRLLAQLLDENPSLRAGLPQVIERAYADGLDLAVAETPLDYGAFPATCPWSGDEILGDHWPDAAPG